MLFAVVVGFMPTLLQIALGVLIVAFVVIPIIKFCMDRYVK